MKRNWKQMTALVLSANMFLSLGGIPVYAEDTVDMSMVGSMAFAKCEEYVNVRSGAGTDTEIVGKIGNHYAAMIIDREGEWYKIKSGNVIGYVKAEYFAIGEEAQQIADEVAYCVAKVHPEALMVRAIPDEEADVVDVAVQNQELEVVQWDGGEWMTVALGNDVYGYVNAYYVDYNKHYAVAETLEEAKASEAAMNTDYAEESGETEAGYTEDGSYETDGDYGYIEDGSYEANPDYGYTEDGSYGIDGDYGYMEDGSYETDEDYGYTEDGSYETDEDYGYTEDGSYEADSDDGYTEETEYVPEVDSDYTEETEYVPETDYVEETEWTEDSDYDEEIEVPTSSLGEEIASFALQFVGNPYVYGGTSLTNGADCSGFVQSVFASYGIWLPRVAADQAYSGTSVDLSSIQAGDLLFYSHGGGISHVALYIGGGQIVHASTSETGIIVSDAYYSTPVCAARYWS